MNINGWLGVCGVWVYEAVHGYNWMAWCMWCLGVRGGAWI